MKKIFYPAIFIMNKLGYTSKIMLLGAIYSTALLVVLFSIYFNQNQHIESTRQELKGIALVKPILSTIQLIQQHRGLSSGALAGNEKMVGRVTASTEVIAKSFETLIVNLPESIISGNDWQAILAEWKQILHPKTSWTKEDNFNAHTHLIDQLQQLLTDISNSHLLTFDSNATSHYLAMATIRDIPYGLEQLGQIRGYGTGILSGKNISAEQKIEIYTLLAKLRTSFDSLIVDLEKNGRYGETTRASLSPAIRRIKQSSIIISDLVRSDILSEQFSTDPTLFYNICTQTIDVGYEQIYRSLLPTLKQLLQVRIEKIKEQLFTSIGIALLLSLLAVYLFIGLYYATISTIQLLANSARKFSQGDMNQRVQLDTKDEIKQIGDSFNLMADGFVKLLAAQQKDAECLQSVINTSLDAIIQINPKGEISGWNHQAVDIFGWTQEEALGQPIHSLIIPERYRKAHLEGVKNYLKSGQRKRASLRVEIEGLHKNGHELPIEISMSPIITKQGIVAFSAYIRDLTERKKAEELLNKLSLAVEQSPSSIIITDLKATIEYANQTFLNNTGYSSCEVIGNNTYMLNSGKTPKETYNDMWTTLAEEKVWKGELINRRKDGSEYTDKILISPVRQNNGKITHYLAIQEDISEKKQAEIELGIAAIAFESQESILVTDSKGVILRVNPSFTKITGYSEGEVVGLTPKILSSGRQDEAFYSAMWKSILEAGTWQGEIWNRRKNGTIYPEWLTISARKDEEDKTTHYVAISTDISKFKAAEERINNLAYYDPLTQLPNRRKFADRLEHGIAMCRRENTQQAVLMLDLDHFKAVNDNFGHLAGDELLQQVAKRISSRLRDTDMVARLGGDEFIILLEDVNHPDDVARIAKDIIDSLSIPFQLNEVNTVQIGTSIGISLYPQHAKTDASLIDHADMALYHAKENGRGCFAFFSDDLTRIVHERLELETNLRLGIKQQELRVYYQAQVDINTGEIIGAEALVRWQKDENTLIPPYKFIPIAEETGLILDIGEWILRETCRQGQQWLNEGFDAITLAVNVSPHQFAQCDMHDLVKTILAETGFPTRQLELEMTETGLMEQQESVIELLENLRALDIQLAIDDFGTGYSSLAYLKRFPIDKLKIDKSFIDDIPQSQEDGKIVATIIDMGHTLGFNVLAEGVETQEQLEFLKAKGCDKYQGYLKSRPIPADEFADLLRKQTARKTISSEQQISVITEDEA